MPSPNHKRAQRAAGAIAGKRIEQSPSASTRDRFPMRVDTATVVNHRREARSPAP